MSIHDRTIAETYADMLTVARSLAESVAKAVPRMHPSTEETEASELARLLIERLRKL